MAGVPVTASAAADADGLPASASAALPPLLPLLLVLPAEAAVLLLGPSTNAQRYANGIDRACQLCKIYAQTGQQYRAAEQSR